VCVCVCVKEIKEDKSEKLRRRLLCEVSPSLAVIIVDIPRCWFIGCRCVFAADLTEPVSVHGDSTECDKTLPNIRMHINTFSLG